MKIIDLLNMIARGEEPPKKIIYDDYIYYFDNKCENYVRDGDIGTSINWDYVVINCLNDEVEILEITIHNKKNKIEPLNIELGKINGKSNNDEIINELSQKINEIIIKWNEDQK